MPPRDRSATSPRILVPDVRDLRRSTPRLWLHLVWGSSGVIDPARSIGAQAARSVAGGHQTTTLPRNRASSTRSTEMTVKTPTLVDTRRPLHWRHSDCLLARTRRFHPAAHPP